MKLRKALDKAKDLRGNSVAPPGRSTTGNGHWKAPVYSESRSDKIDFKVVEDNRGVCMMPDAAEIQRYKILRTRIQQQTKGRGLNTIMVTSPNKREGKTVTSINMAFTFARELNQTVLLVDCDFTGQDIHRYLGIQSSASLVDYFVDDVPLNELIIWPGIEKLSLISGNRTVNDSSELLSSPLMKEAVEDMKNRYDDRYVLFDAPPVLEHADAISLAPLVDGVIMVIQAGVTSKRDVQRAVDMIPREKFLGFVLNRQK
ncbi:MAG: AAA family ATPase [Desulfobacteraceae bacterium]|nr:AAA family ATPase [Desulfobacteraceae bacterium]